MSQRIYWRTAPASAMSQDLLGHKSIEHTARYTENILKIFRQYHPKEHELFEEVKVEKFKPFTSKYVVQELGAAADALHIVITAIAGFDYISWLLAKIVCCLSIIFVLNMQKNNTEKIFLSRKTFIN